MAQSTKLQKDENILLYEKKQELINNETIIKNTIDFSESYDTCVLVFTGDWHIGTVDFDIYEAEKVINYVLQTPNAKMLCLGDMMNAAIVNSVSNQFEDIIYPQEQWDVFVSLLKQVAEQGKLVAVHTGNHERRISKDTSLDPMKQAADSLNAPQAHAPYFADTKLVLKCPYSKSGKFSFPLVTHHGDNGNPEKNASIDNDSLVNAIGHTHNFKSYITTKTIRGKKRDILNIVIPALAGGNYGYQKGYKPIHKEAYHAIEVTAVLNPLYDRENPNSKEAPIILSTKSIPILTQATTDSRQKTIKEGMKVIDKKVRAYKAIYFKRIAELIDILEKCNVEISQDLKNAVTKKIIEEAKKLSPEKKKRTPKKVEVTNNQNDELKEIE